MRSKIQGNEENAFEAKSFVGSNEFKVSGWGVRHTQCLILFFTLTIAYSMRSCIGVALIAMTSKTTYKSDVMNEGTNFAGVNVISSTINITYENVDEEDFITEGFFNALLLSSPYPSLKWSKKVQDTVLASFFWGYMALQIPAGQLAHRFGPRYLLTGAMLINCVASAGLPLAAFYGGWICTVIFRVLQGLSQACIIPSIHTFLGKWARLEERGRLSSLIYGGEALGTVLGLSMTGFIASSSLGWPGIFRCYAILSGTIGGLVWWLSADAPANHSNISAAEKKYIEDGLGQKPGYEKMQYKQPVPWSEVFRCRGIYAIIVAHVGYTWGQLVLYLKVPAFMNQVMGINIEANGLLSALPFMVMWLTYMFFSWFTDMLIVKKVMTVTNIRKLANSMGCLPPALGLTVLTLVPKNIYIVETILVVICAFKTSSFCGFQVNHIDISPNFAGTLMSLSNFAANSIGCFVPIVSGIMLTDVSSVYLWRQVFCVTAGVYFFTNLFYVIFGTAERADWNDLDHSKTDEEAASGEIESMLAKNSGND